MPLTGAERNRLYRERIKSDPVRYAENLEKERNRYAKRKEKGDIRSINQLSDREKRAQRRKWRERKKRERTRKNHQSMEVEPDLTPPPTPSPFPIVIGNDSRRSRGRKKLRRERSKAYRKIADLEKELQVQKRLNEKLRKRVYRMKIGSKICTPRKQTQKLLLGQRVKDKTRKMLLFHNVLIDNLRKRYKEMTVERQKQIFSKLVVSKTLKKYRVQNMTKESLDMSYRRISYSDKSFVHTKKIQKNSLIRTLKTRVQDFLTRDDNSRIKAGKKASCTQKKEKRQIRLLTDTMKNLHLKFLSEDHGRRMSYSLFCRLRPFYVRFPRPSDRETCLCKRHENVRFKAEKLKELKLIQTTDLLQNSRQIVCSLKSKSCMYRICSECKNSKMIFYTEQVDLGQMIEYYEWKTQRVQATPDSSEKVKIMTVKVKEKTTIGNLISEYQEELSKCCSHFYNIQHQYEAIADLKRKLSEKEMLIHVDFSENYSCKYESEIQSVHFGASQRQISLHTGVLYTKNQIEPFTSISDCLKHSPSGIWGHLKPVLTHVKQQYPNVKHLFFLSDGPSTQYKNKENFHLLSTFPFQFEFSSVNWNFTESGHGKGAPDGIGATIKREADRLVSYGRYITDAKSMYDMLKASKLGVTLFLVEEDDINKVENRIKSRNLVTIPGTMKIHQISCHVPRTVSFRDVSCFCHSPYSCACYAPKSYTFQQGCDDTRIEDQNASHSLKFSGSEHVDSSSIGRHCVVTYDGLPYPGVIQDVDSSEIEVNVMHSVGDNRFFWPRHDDVLWYKAEQFITLIPPPKKITRHFEIQRDMWQRIKSHLKL